MAYEILHLIKKIELDAQTDSAGATFTLSTDVPNGAQAVVFSGGFSTGGARENVEFVMRGTTRAQIAQATVSLAGAGACRLFGARALVKALGQPGSNTWTWTSLPVRVTPEAYGAGGLPIRPTADGYTGAALPVRPTPDAYGAGGLPIRPTSDGYTQGPLPLAQVSPLPQWVTIPVDPIEIQTQPYRPFAGEG